MRNPQLFAIIAALLLFANGASAQNPSDATEQRLKALEDKIIALEGQLRLLKSSQSVQPTAAMPAPAAAEPSPALTPDAPVPEVAERTLNLGGARNAGKVLNPDISVVGNFVGSAGRNDYSPVRSLEMKESEIGLQAIIDPYARGDFFISFGEEGVELEEGYITFTALPKGFVAKVGKMRSVFGKVNLMHSHTLPWIDRPLVTENLVGGEEGIGDAGFSINRILPAPGGLFLEATGQVFRGDSADVFRATNRSDVSAVAHLRAYKDLTESTNLDLGFSYARGHNDSQLDCTACLPSNSGFLTNLYGVDATLRWKPLRRSIYRSFVARSEFVWSQRQQPGAALGGAGAQRAFGYYAAADYQFARRWYTGFRFDQSDRARAAFLTDRGGSWTLTFWPSEFSQIRGQYRVTGYDNVFATPSTPALNSKITNEFRIQFLFSLGAHGAHAF